MKHVQRADEAGADNTSEGMSLEWLDRMAAVVRVLAHRHRLKMIERLELRKHAPVHELAEAAGLPPAAASQHLNQLKRVGLVRSLRQGKEVWYAIADRRALTILHCMRKQYRSTV